MATRRVPKKGPNPPSSGTGTPPPMARSTPPSLSSVAPTTVPPTTLAAVRSAQPPRTSSEAAVSGEATPLGDPVPAKPAAAPKRPVIENVRPQVDGGRFPAKSAVGDMVCVEADVFADGHDLLACEVRFQREGDATWTSVAMDSLGNDRWRGGFVTAELGRYRFVVRGCIDRYATWLRGLMAWAAAGQDLTAELAAGAELLADVAQRARGSDRRKLAAASEVLAQAQGDLDTPIPQDLASELDVGGDATAMLNARTLRQLVRRYRQTADTTSSPPFPLVVEPERARFSTWYELFPRSASPVPGRQGTLADVLDRLHYVERLGFDVLYLPPIHPIGVTGRKGHDGATVAGPDDPGSPWAIGSEAGGHTAVDPALGTIDDFDALVAAAARRGISIALDLAFQCSPDHPWVRSHPEWFRHRPDGSIRYAENPPKRYEDIYPLDFETEAWWELWLALLEVVRHWIAHGVSVFRVDNPHTKPFAFWEWLIATVKSEHPEVIFLAEAFTRPAVMNRLAKLGFSQSYTYFTWRNSKWELETYMRDLAEVRDFFRPNFWPNTPDILTEVLQFGATPAFVARLVLAATLSSSYGVYGPAFELQEHVARAPGSEEYAGSEKYAIRHWDLERRDSLAPLLARINQVRHSHPALQRNDTLRFHHTDNDQLIAYSKSSGDDVVLVVVNLDPRYRQSGWVDLTGLDRGSGQAVEVRDLVTDARFRWEGTHSFVILDPATVPAHVLAVAPAQGLPR